MHGVAYFKFWLQPARTVTRGFYGPEYFNAAMVHKSAQPINGAVPFEQAQHGTLALLMRVADWLPVDGDELRTTHALISAIQLLTSDGLDYGETVLWPK